MCDRWEPVRGLSSRRAQELPLWEVGRTREKPQALGPEEGLRDGGRALLGLGVAVFTKSSEGRGQVTRNSRFPREAGCRYSAFLILCSAP